MKKTIAMHEQKDKQRKADDGAKGSAVPAYLLEREQASTREGGSLSRQCCCGPQIRGIEAITALDPLLLVAGRARQGAVQHD